MNLWVDFCVVIQITLKFQYEIIKISSFQQMWLCSKTPLFQLWAQKTCLKFQGAKTYCKNYWNRCRQHFLILILVGFSRSLRKGWRISKTFENFVSLHFRRVLEGYERKSSQYWIFDKLFLTPTPLYPLELSNRTQTLFGDGQHV